MINTETLLKVKEMVKKHILAGKFIMYDYFTDDTKAGEYTGTNICGTACCIAGTMQFMGLIVVTGVDDGSTGNMPDVRRDVYDAYSNLFHVINWKEFSPRTYNYIKSKTEQDEPDNDSFDKLLTIEEKLISIDWLFEDYIAKYLQEVA